MMTGPLALMGTSVTVRSVTLVSLLSHTPVSLVKELVQVKERRLVVSSEGKVTGEREGQLMNWRSWSVERDLRAVMERETSEEQLVRRRERRWRKGLEVSQWTAALGFEQGSLEVGRLRDWRASSCFGSSVEEVVVDGAEEGG